MMETMPEASNDPSSVAHRRTIRQDNNEIEVIDDHHDDEDVVFVDSTQQHQQQRHKRNRALVLLVVIGVAVFIVVACLLATNNTRRFEVNQSAQETQQHKIPVVRIDNVGTMSGGTTSPVSAPTTSNTTGQSTDQPSSNITTSPSTNSTEDPTLSPSPSAAPSPPPTITIKLGCLPDRFDNEQMDILDPTVNFRQLHPGQFICSEPYSESQYRFGVTESGDVIWQDTINRETRKMFENPTGHTNVYFSLRVDATMVVTDATTDTVLWEAAPVNIKHPMTHYPRCLPNHDCPYFHLHSDGVLVMNYIAGDGDGWQATNLFRVYDV